MTRFERIEAALSGAETDRVPGGFWYHLSEVDQDAEALAEMSAAFVEKYDFDFIKLMPFGLYTVQDWGARVRFFRRRGEPPVIEDYGVHEAKDWGSLTALPPESGAWGLALRTARCAAALTAGKTPFVQTVFSPLTTALKLAGPRLFGDMRESPALVKKALEVITETTTRFVRANIEAGVSGFFFATQCASTDLMTESEYREFGAVYDMRVISAYKDAVFFNILHIHGKNIMFRLLEEYPVPCFNWHDRSAGPSLAEARVLTDKCLLGGLEEMPEFSGKTTNIVSAGSAAELERYVHEAIAQAGGRRFILGPGCVASPLTPEANIRAIRRALDTYRR
jgi:uroporphyrinogen decarboxylase